MMKGKLFLVLIVSFLLIGLASAATVSNVVLSSTSGEDHTSDNLTVSFDLANADSQSTIIDWRLSASSLALLNMPFSVVDAGSVTKDYSTNEYDGTVFGGPTWDSSCKIGGCYEFDGVNDYVSMGTQKLGYQNLTVSVWFKYIDDGVCTNLYEGIVSKNGWRDFVIGVTCTGGGSGKVGFYALNDATDIASITTTAVISDDLWHHVVGTCDGTVCKMYLDGNYENQAALLGPVVDTNAELTIGRHAGITRFFNGSIDEVLIFNRSLNAEQISEIYQAGAQNKSGFTTIVSDETNVYDNWAAVITPSNGSVIGTSGLSNSISVDTPSVSNVLLSSTSGRNHTRDNLTVSFDIKNADSQSTVIDWRVEGTSLAILNMPFNVNVSTSATGAVQDYSTYGNDATLGGGVSTQQPIWTDSNCMVGGCYDFAGVDEYLSLDNPFTGNVADNNFTFTTWMNLRSVGAYDSLINFGLSSHNYQVMFSSAGFISIYSGSPINSACRISRNEWLHYALFKTGPTTRIVVRNMTSVVCNESIIVGSGTYGTGMHFGTNDGPSYQYSDSIYDEILLFEKVLSDEQVELIYEAGLSGNSFATISSRETNVDDNWTAMVTPSDVSSIGTSVLSGNVEISLDKVAPILNFTSPTPSTNSFLDVAQIIINYTITEATKVFSFIDLDNSTTWLAMNKIIGGIIVDELNQNNATLIGGTQVGNTIHLNEEEHITITDSTDFNSSNEFSISLDFELGSMSPVKEVHSGGDHTCVLLSDGSALCWGQNNDGQLGDGTTTERNVPVLVLGDYNFTTISSGRYHTCGLLSNGEALCWGDNSRSQLGNSETTNKLIPTPVSGNHNFTSISSGSLHTCGILTNGEALCWGRNYFGQLGDGTQDRSIVPNPVSGSYSFAQISAGHDASCGILTSGEAMCWGDGNNGQLGDGLVIDSNIPVFVSGNHNFTTLLASEQHACGLLENGEAMCWGRGWDGRLGSGTVDKHVPTPVSGNHNFTDISIGMSHSCGILTNGSAMCWGEGEEGRIGVDSTNRKSAPAVVAGDHNFKSISAGEAHSCGIAENNSIYCWGRSKESQTGINTNTKTYLPKSVVSDYNFTSISAGSHHACGLLENGEVMCFGKNEVGEIGDGTKSSKNIPTLVLGGHNFSKISIGETNSFGILLNGSVLGWGTGWHGRLGNGGVDKIIPDSISGNHNFSKIAAGRMHGCGLLANGEALCWGWGTSGQLGAGSTSNSYTPVFVLGGHIFKDISVSYFTSCGILTNGSVMCWGQGSNGQLGSGNTSNTNIPTLVAGNQNFKNISLGNYHACGLLTSGEARCWGRGFNGKLGNGDTLNKNIPTLVSGNHNFSKISAGGENSCGLLTNGKAMCWGDNSEGQLGNGETLDKNTPTLVLGNNTFTDISTGNLFTCGLSPDKSLKCWGENIYGQLGTGETLSLTPQEVIRGLLVEKSSDSYSIGVGFSGNLITIIKNNRIISTLPTGKNNILLSYIKKGQVYVNGILSVENNYNLNIENLVGDITIGKGIKTVINNALFFSRSLNEVEAKALNSSMNSTFEIQNFSIAEGLHNYAIYAMDLAGNIGISETRIITTDFSAPVGTYTTGTPANNSVTKEIFVNLSVYDTSSYNITFNLYNKTALVNSTFDLGQEEITWNSLPDGIYYYNATLIDILNHKSTTVTRMISVDNTAPLIITNFPTPVNNSGVKDTFIINLTLIDAIKLESINYTFNGTTESINTTLTTTSILSNSVHVTLTKTNSTYWNIEISQTGLESGKEYDYELEIFDIVGNMNSTGIQHVLGNTPTTLKNLTYSPSINLDMDPDSTIIINYTLKDQEKNFNSWVLQIKKSNENWTDAENLTSTNYLQNETLYHFNSSYALDGSTESDYILRVLTTDNEGINYTSPETILNVFWDCEWNFSTTLGAVAGWDENKFIGNITINNLGDSEFTADSCNLNFHMTHNLDGGRIYFNDWSLNKWVKYYDAATIPAASSSTIEINSTFLSEIKQEGAIINLLEVGGISATGKDNTSFTMVSNKDGPYLFSSIDTAPLSASLTAGSFNVISQLKNLMGAAVFNQNKTAYNVTSNWILPSGLVISSGNQSMSYDNISDSSPRINAVEFGMSGFATMTPGQNTISIKTTGYNYLGELITDSSNNSELIESININFVCYSPKDGVHVTACGPQDGDYVAPVVIIPGSSSGSGGGSGSGSSNLFLKSEASFELLNGELKEFILPIKNDYAFTKKDIKIQISGDNSEYVIPETELISEILSKGEFLLKVKINAPSYFSSGKYLLKFRLSGKLEDENGKRIQYFNEEKYVTLYITDRTRDQADIYLDEAKIFIKEMTGKNLSIKGASDLFEEMNSSYSEVSFLNVEDSFSELELIYKSATGFSPQLEEIEEKLAWAKKYGIDPMETKKLVMLANVVFERGDYVLAQKKLSEAILMYSYETKGELKLYYVIKNNIIQFLIAFALLIIVANMSYYFGKRQRLARKIKRLQHEEKLLLELMKSVQKETFTKGEVSMNEYHDAMNQYETHLSEVVQEKIQAESRLVNFSNFRGKKKALFHERNKVIKLMQNLQIDYLKKGTMDTRVYNNLLKSHSLRLSKIEEEIAFMELKSFMSKSHLKEMKGKLNSKYPESQKKERKKVIKKVKKKAKIEKLEKIKKSSKKGNIKK